MKLKLLHLQCSKLCNMELHKSTEFIFPTAFKFGVGTAAYQIEGACNEEGKSETSWDYYSHLFPLKFKSLSNGDVSCNSYHKMGQDLSNLSALYVDFYRFSISWSRIFSTGFPSHINNSGAAYYKKLLQNLNLRNIAPVVTLHHADLPQCLEFLGGWTNPLLVDLFVDYAHVCFKEFGKWVKIWITLDAPNSVAQLGYGDGKIAPFVESDGIGTYLAVHHMLLAHGKCYRLYHKYFEQTQQGTVGIAIDCPWFEPYTTNNTDVDAADRMLQMYIGWIANPLFSHHGDYPSVMRTRIDKNSEEQGYWLSRLPSFTQEEVLMLQGAADFFGVNHYHAFNVTQANIGVIPSNDNDTGAHYFVDDHWKPTARALQKVLPWGLSHVLKWITEMYNKPLLFITGNGFAGIEQEDDFNDDQRSSYIIEYLKEVAKAITDYDCDISAYTYFPFMDCFEGTDGYSIRSGLYRVNFQDPERPRMAKRSAHVFKQIASTHQLIPNFSNTSTNMGNLDSKTKLDSKIIVSDTSSLLSLSENKSNEAEIIRRGEL